MPIWPVLEVFVLDMLIPALAPLIPAQAGIQNLTGH
jgi:hypothetical protein